MTRISLRTVVLAAPLVAAAAGACSTGPAETFGASGATSSAGTSTSSAGTSTSSAAGTSNSSAAGTSNSSVAGTSTSSAGTSTNSAGSAGTSPGGSGSANTSGASGATTGGAGGGTTAGTGTGGTGGAGACETVDCVAGVQNDNMDKMTNAFFIFGCYSKANQDCITIPSGMTCPNQDGTLPFEEQGISVKQTFTLGGTPGKSYLLTITVNGIAEAKYYENGTRAAGDSDPPNPNAPNGIDTFYTGGDPVNFENYNVYKIVTQDAAGKEIQHYYLNSFPKTAVAYEHHETFPLAFTHDIQVVGGGKIVLFESDRNCHAINNCGIGFHDMACADNVGRALPNEPNLVLPTKFVGTPLSTLNAFGGTTQPFHSQVIHVVANAIKPM